MIKGVWWLFLLATLGNSLLLRTGVIDAYLFKKTHREEREFYKSGNLRFRILLPYQKMRNCCAPRHMLFFQVFRFVNLIVAITSFIVSLYGIENAVAVYVGYAIMGAHFFAYQVPFFIYSLFLMRQKPKGWDFSKVKDHKK